MRNILRTSLFAFSALACVALAGSHPSHTESGSAQGIKTAAHPRIQVSSAAVSAPVVGAQAVLNRVVCDQKQNWNIAYWCELSDIDPKSRDSFGQPTATTVGRSEDPNGINNATDPQVMQVYTLLGDVYDFYKQRFSYDLTDNIGLGYADDPSYKRVLSATVNSCDGFVFVKNRNGEFEKSCNGDNAFWQPAPEGMVGGSMSIGAGLAGLSDVIAHEMQHGVTGTLAQLQYQGQSGAINESISDIFGELIDRAQALKRYGSYQDDWTIGEGHTWTSVATKPIDFLRSMKDPYGLPAVKPTRLRGQASSCKGWQPDRMSSPCWDTDPLNQDYGGVHTNSGVGNKAAYLMSVGGTFNGRTIKGMGDDATAQLWWAVLPRLWATTNYYQLANRLMDVCPGLEQQSLIPNGACNDTVLPALSATEMNVRRVTFSTLLSSVRMGTAIRPTVTVFDALRVGASKPMSSQIVTLQMQQSNGSWIGVTSGLTDSGGKTTLAYTIRTAGKYRLFVPAQGASPAVAGTTVTISIRK